METSNESTGETLFDLTSYAEVIHASPSRLRENGTENTIHDTCGHSYETPLADYDPGTQSWRMFGDTFLSGESPLLETLPPSGMTRNGALFQQPAWVPITDVIGSSSWPTPRSSSAMNEDMETLKERLDNGTPYKSRLEEAVAMWPTPRAALGDARNHTVYERSLDKPQNLENKVGAADPSTIGGKLNPTWVEWLMGFPPGWTALED